MKTETFNKQARVAFAAITEHMIEHDLPAPMSIDKYEATQVVRVMLDGGPEAQAAWVASVDVIDEQTETFAHPSAGIRSWWQVRLPNLGIVFEMVGFRSEPFLTAVSA